MPAALNGFIKGDTVDKLIATCFAIVVNYVGNRLFVFNQKPQSAQQIDSPKTNE